MIAMIWLSLNRLLRMLLTPRMDSTITWRDFRGAGHRPTTPHRSGRPILENFGSVMSIRRASSSGAPLVVPDMLVDVRDLTPWHQLMHRVEQLGQTTLDVLL